MTLLLPRAGRCQRRPAMPTTHDLDTTGLLCPLPVLKIRKRMKSMRTGEVLRVRADDPAAAIDIPHFCAEQGQELVESTLGPTCQVFLIRKIDVRN